MTYQQFLDNLSVETLTVNGELFDADNDDQQMLLKLSLNYMVPYKRKSMLSSDDLMKHCDRFWRLIVDNA